MSTDPVNNSVSKLDLLKAKTELSKSSETSNDNAAFDRLLEETIGKVASLQKEAEKAINELASGDGDIVQAMISMQKAEISFKTMVEVRNKLISAYEEIMRMQV